MEKIKKVKVSNTGDAVSENLEIDWSKHEELKEIAKLLVDFLGRYYDLHCSIIINAGFIKVVRDEIGVPFQIEDGEEERNVHATYKTTTNN